MAFKAPPGLELVVTPPAVSQLMPSEVACSEETRLRLFSDWLDLKSLFLEVPDKCDLHSDVSTDDDGGDTSEFDHGDIDCDISSPMLMPETASVFKAPPGLAMPPPGLEMPPPGLGLSPPGLEHLVPFELPMPAPLGSLAVGVEVESDSEDDLMVFSSPQELLPSPCSCGASEGFLEDSDVATSDGGDMFDTDNSDTDGEFSPLVMPLSREGTILFIDWDDTLLPSTWIQDHGPGFDEDGEASDREASLLMAMAAQASKTLYMAMELGQVVIVTNASAGWVEWSCSKFMPSLYPILEQVKIISARSTYEALGYATPTDWKRAAFQDEIKSFYGSVPNSFQKNIISIGDATYERDALLALTESFPNSYGKTLKLMERPGVELLHWQHELITRSLCSAVKHNGNLDLAWANNRFRSS